MTKAKTSQSKNERVQQIATGDRAILPEGAKTIPIYIMGKKYEVPETLTIMKAMEYAGFQFLRGCGCRAGICGAWPAPRSRPRCCAAARLVSTGGTSCCVERSGPGP